MSAWGQFSHGVTSGIPLGGLGFLTVCDSEQIAGLDLFLVIKFLSKEVLKLTAT